MKSGLVGQLLRHYRLQHNHTPQRLAALLGLRPEKGARLIVNLERNGVARANLVERITEALHIAPGAILDAREELCPQLVGFSDPETQVPRYAEAMARAGFTPLTLSDGEEVCLARQVHNRKWRVRNGRAGGSELLLIHRKA